MNSKLQDTLEQIEEQLDVALAKTCSGFDEAHYSKVQKAYRQLGKTQVSKDVIILKDKIKYKQILKNENLNTAKFSHH